MYDVYFVINCNEKDIKVQDDRLKLELPILFPDSTLIPERFLTEGNW